MHGGWENTKTYCCLLLAEEYLLTEADWKGTICGFASYLVFLFREGEELCMLVGRRNDGDPEVKVNQLTCREVKKENR